MRSPSDLTVTAVNLTTVLARWSPIPKNEVEGILLGYKVIVWMEGTLQFPENVTTNETTIIVTNLQVKKYYVFYVQVYTSKDTGLPATYNFYTGT